MNSVVTLGDGLGTSWSVGAPEDGFIRYYAGKEGGGGGDGRRWNSGSWVLQLQRLETVAPKRWRIKKPVLRCSGGVVGDRFWSSESHKSLLLNCRVATESYEMKSVFTRKTILIRTTKSMFRVLGLIRISKVCAQKSDISVPKREKVTEGFR